MNFSFYTMTVQSICNKNQALEKIKNKKYFMKEQFKIFSIFTNFRAVSCIFSRTKKNFETSFTMLLYTQLQKAISN